MLKVYELLKATRGRLLGGSKETKIKGISIDSRIIKPQEAFIAIRGRNFDGHSFIDEAIKKGANCIIKESGVYPVRDKTPKVSVGCLRHPISNGVNPRTLSKMVFIEVKNTTKALGDIARFQRNKFNIPIVAVTGSSGKTTTKEMLSWILSKRLQILKNDGTKNNQIGLPLTLLKLNNSYDIVVLELGTNHFGEIRYLTKICQPNVGIINNIGPAHLEYLRNLKGVFYEKYALIKNLQRPHIAILNADDGLLKGQVFKNIKKPCILGFGIQNRCDFFASDIKIVNGKIKFLINHDLLKEPNAIKQGPAVVFTLKTLGYYNIYNALAAIAVARIFGMEYRDIAKRLAVFQPLAGRLNLKMLNRVRFIDDTYNSNPLSLNQALDTLANFKTKGRKIFVMGDMLELGSGKKLLHYQVGKKIRDACDALITVGNLSKFAAEAARLYGFEFNNIFTCESTNQARDILFNQISPTIGDIVLVKGSRAMRMEDIFKT